MLFFFHFITKKAENIDGKKKFSSTFSIQLMLKLWFTYIVGQYLLLMKMNKNFDIILNT
jgi:hypothetical protein